MPKTLLVAIREYKSTVMTKAFIFGAVILPIVIWALAIAIPTLVKDDIPQMTGTIAVVDETDEVGALFESQMSAAYINIYKEKLGDISEEDLKELIKEKVDNNAWASEILASLSLRQIKKIREMPTPDITFVDIASDDSDLDILKERVRAGEYLAVVYVRDNALELPESAVLQMLRREAEATNEEDNQVDDSNAEAPPTLYIYTNERMHIENSDYLKSTLAQSVVTLKGMHNSINHDLVQRVTVSPYVQVINVTEKGEHEANEMADMFVPFGFMLLLWICTFTGGQYLLTTTIEEKSSKVIEVLLSATSPMQLMTGKILGQGAVALTMVVIYGALAGGGLSKFGGAEYINPLSILLVAPYFIMAFFFIACMMAAIGSAVNDMREAQALMGPVMMVIMLPLLAWFPIVRSPDGLFATVLSFVPPMTPFVMALRLGSKQPPGWFQIILTLIIGFTAVFIAMWCTAKIFRIGVLMFGKPPDIRTLARWIWQA